MQVFQAFARPANQDRKYFPYDPTKAKPMGTGLVNPSEEVRESRRKLVEQQQEALKKAAIERFGPDYWWLYVEMLRGRTR